MTSREFGSAYSVFKYTIFTCEPWSLEARSLTRFLWERPSNDRYEPRDCFVRWVFGILELRGSSVYELARIWLRPRVLRFWLWSTLLIRWFMLFSYRSASVYTRSVFCFSCFYLLLGRTLGSRILWVCESSRRVLDLSPSRLRLMLLLAINL